MRKLWFACGVAVGCATWLDCSNATTTDDAGADAGKVFDAKADVPLDVGADVDTDAGECNALTLPGTIVHEQKTPGALPVPTGGPFTDGTYVATSAAAYTGVDGGTGQTAVTYQVTDVVVGNTFEVAQGNVVLPPRTSGTFATDAGSFSATILCPTSAPPYMWNAFDANADAGTFTLYLMNGGGIVTQSLTLTKQ